MKLSAYYKRLGNDVSLKLDYDSLCEYDMVFISKVFTNTIVPDKVLTMPNVQYGGTGFYYDKAPSLGDEIEHIMPDYHLYDDWVGRMVEGGVKPKELTYYTDYSIGFLTRGCIRGCEFCVNRNETSCNRHSNVHEFFDESRPKLCFLDDNFLACNHWREIIEDVKSLGRRFQFKQGLDERLLTDEKIHEIVSWAYDGNLIFAFDNIDDRDVIESKLKRIYELYPKFKRQMKFYVLCGFDRNGRYDTEFWINDIRNTFERCLILAKYSALPYIMRYEKCYDSDFVGVYSVIASWTNQPHIFKKFDFATYAMCAGMKRSDYKIYGRNIELYLKEIGRKGSTWRYLDYMVENHRDIADRYFHIVPDSLLEFGVGNIFERNIINY